MMIINKDDKAIYSDWEDNYNITVRNAIHEKISFYRAIIPTRRIWTPFLSNIDFREADMTKVNFLICDMCHADLRGAELQGALFQSVDLCGADLRNIKFDEKTKFINCYFDGDTMMDEELREFIIAQKV